MHKIVKAPKFYGDIEMLNDWLNEICLKDNMDLVCCFSDVWNLPVFIFHLRFTPTIRE